MFKILKLHHICAPSCTSHTTWSSQTIQYNKNEKQQIWNYHKYDGNFPTYLVLQDHKDKYGSGSLLQMEEKIDWAVLWLFKHTEFLVIWKIWIYQIICPFFFSFVQLNIITVCAKCFGLEKPNIVNKTLFPHHHVCKLQQIHLGSYSVPNHTMKVKVKRIEWERAIFTGNKQNLQVKQLNTIWTVCGGMDKSHFHSKYILLLLLTNHFTITINRLIAFGVLSFILNQQFIK